MRHGTDFHVFNAFFIEFIITRRGWTIATNKERFVELMALCDILKVRLSESQTTQVNLANAIIEQAISPEVEQ